MYTATAPGTRAELRRGAAPARRDNLIWYVEACLNNALRLETYIEDAEREKDTEVAELFRQAQADSRKGADLGKQFLHRRLSD
ncbi:hypothetical protein P1P68_06395 [Streptomyces scabiei]|uniref:hypothetical protein n=1 Tax=Streptomyces scabiei TaxID=1930 RepID=UPI00298FBCB0|nr:hypothetical protein [Streptomyces scabiei]MDW8804430.1 hypothetical protein [Streptomyces scabiei]